jgi:16S rRNA (cytidine1402-2'-O)-methyltransferase
MFYIVSTPIGNLNDLSLRQAYTIASSDYLLCEDTRSAATLLQYIKNKLKINIKSGQRIVSYYKDREYDKSFKVLELLKQKRTVSLISESGTPLISDPGLYLFKLVIKNNIPYSVIPGPTALITALVNSGFKFKSFLFTGFLPKKEKEVIKTISNFKKINSLFPDTILIFYESTFRIIESLKIFDKLIPNANISVCREMTKKFEEIIRGKPKELINRKYKGEITVVLSI